MPESKKRKPRNSRPITRPEAAVVAGEVVEEDRPLELVVAYRNGNEETREVAIKTVALGLEPIVLITFNQEENRVEIDSTGFDKEALRNFFEGIAEAIPTLDTNTTKEN